MALEPTRTLALRRSVLVALREQHPSVDRFLITIMAGYVRRLSAMVLEAMYLPVEQRVRHQLAHLARIYGGDAHRAEIHLTQDDIANLASTSPTHRSAHDNRPTNPAADDACAEETDTEQTWAEQRPHHYGDLLRYASYLLAGDTPTAEDVAQETAIRLWQHPEVLTDDQPLAGWLRTVARNIVIDRTRRRRARPAEVTLSPGIDSESPGDLDHIDAASVTTILSGLSPRHRTVVFEVYIRDRPITGTGTSRCHTALRQLRTTTTLPTCA